MSTYHLPLGGGELYTDLTEDEAASLTAEDLWAIIAGSSCSIMWMNDGDVLRSRQVVVICPDLLEEAEPNREVTR